MHRHGRACPGHPRLWAIGINKEDVDARHKAGHDEEETGGLARTTETTCLL
jgi:hypothetical protein